MRTRLEIPLRLGWPLAWRDDHEDGNTDAAFDSDSRSFLGADGMRRPGTGRFWYLPQRDAGRRDGDLRIDSRSDAITRKCRSIELTG
jgi:hypothetical protein